jgi:hypothetical protein
MSNILKEYQVFSVRPQLPIEVNNDPARVTAL